jgi:hypothetical protein
MIGRVMAWPYVTAAGILALALAFLLMAQCERRRVGAREAELRAEIAELRRDSVTQAREIGRVDSVFTTDTLRLTGTVTRFRTRVDSLLRTDTLTVRESVIVAAADTAIRACQSAVTSCAQRVAARDSMLVLLGMQRAADRRLFEARLRRANPRILPFVDAAVDARDESTVFVRGGLELRLLGPIRVTGAVQYTNLSPDHRWALPVGVRVTF